MTFDALTLATSLLLGDVVPVKDSVTRRRYAKLSEAAEYLGVTDRTIRQMIADGRISGYRAGSRLVRVDLNEIDKAMRPFGGAA